jgi:hypothetical protein
MKQVASINMIDAGSCTAYSSAVKMEATCFSEMFDEFERTT